MVIIGLKTGGKEIIVSLSSVRDPSLTTTISEGVVIILELVLVLRLCCLQFETLFETKNYFQSV
jgi:hypothetical protein